MILAELTMYPLDQGESLSKYVARSLEIIEASGLAYRFGPMSTTLEGEWDEVMAVIKRCYERMHEDCRRIECSVRIDARDGPGGRIDSKMASVERAIGHSLKK